MTIKERIMFIIENNNVLSRSIVAKDILDDLKKDIIVKNITPGTKLTEKYLLKKYEVSRVPVRSVLHTLAHQGFLKFGKNGVHYVPNFSIKYFEDVYDVRALLERNAVEIILKSNFVNYSPILQSLSILKEKSNLIKKNNKQNENIDIALLTLSIHYHIVEVSDNKALLNA